MGKIFVFIFMCMSSVAIAQVVPPSDQEQNPAQDQSQTKIEPIQLSTNPGDVFCFASPEADSETTQIPVMMINVNVQTSQMSQAMLIPQLANTDLLSIDGSRRYSAVALADVETRKGVVLLVRESVKWRRGTLSDMKIESVNNNAIAINMRLSARMGMRCYNVTGQVFKTNEFRIVPGVRDI